DRILYSHEQSYRDSVEHEQVGGDVRPRTRVDAADPAGRSHPDTGPVSRPDRRAHRGRAERARYHRGRDVAPRHLDRRVRRGEPFQLGSLEADPDGAVDHADPAGGRPGAADRGLHPLDALEVAWVRETLTDHARLQPDDGVSGG